MLKPPGKNEESPSIFHQNNQKGHLCSYVHPFLACLQEKMKNPFGTSPWVAQESSRVSAPAMRPNLGRGVVSLKASAWALARLSKNSPLHGGVKEAQAMARKPSPFQVHPTSFGHNGGIDGIGKSEVGHHTTRGTTTISRLAQGLRIDFQQPSNMARPGKEGKTQRLPFDPCTKTK